MAEADRRIALGRESERAGRLAEAREHYAAAAALAPGNASAQVDLGIVLDALSDSAGAARAFEAALALDPGHAYANYNLGRLQVMAGSWERARPLLEAALAARPDFPEAQIALATALEAQGDLAGAEQALSRALALRPEDAGALRNYGSLLGRLGRWADAAASLRRAADADPSDAQALVALGTAYVTLGKSELALQAYREATERQPGLAEAWCRRGNVLADGRSHAQALACFHKALELSPDYADAHLGLGNVYGALSQLEEAEKHYRRTLALDAPPALAQLNLGIVLTDQGRLEEALDCLRSAVQLHPEWPEARWAYAMAHVPAIRGAHDDLPAIRRRVEQAIRDLDRWFDESRVAAGHGAVGIQQLFWLAYQEENNRPLLQAYGQLCARLMGRWQRERGYRPRAARKPGAVRVGVVSQHLREHSVWHAIVRGWFRELDKARFSLVAFCLHPQEDDETRVAHAHAARFEQGHIGLERWCEVIVDADPDVLVYPEVGMDPMTLRLASLRLARVQAASWGHPETTGLPTIDYYLSAEGMEPAQAEDGYTETLVRLPNLGCHVEDRGFEAQPADLARWGIDPGLPILICPGTPFKYAPEHDRVLADIARRLGRCQIVFFEYRVRPLSAGLRARLAAQFARHGADFERCVRFLPWLPSGDFRSLLRAADVFLDTIGFSGFNTALQAIDAGLPIVTCEGRFLRGRLASGILRRVGLEELVAADGAQYVELAVRLARDRDYRESIRARMTATRHRLYGDPEPIRALERFLAQGE